ncbi:MAG: potassium transporter TrkG, partial [Chloroflexota bacterium]
VYNGYPIGDSLFEFASAIGTVGLSVGITSPDMPLSAMWVMSLAMLLGRLEFYAVVIGIAKLVMDTRDVLDDDEDSTVTDETEEIADKTPEPEPAAP